MIKKKLCLLLATVMTTSVLTTGFSNGVVANASTNQVSIIKSVEDETQIILTELPYESSSYTKYKNINKNANTDGKEIKLKLFGEVVQFEKGIGAHAESSIVYNVEKHTNKLTRLRGYAGVDFARGGNGNGIIVSVQTSEDGIEWKEKFKSGVVKGNSECIVLDVDVTGAKFIKLFANDNGGNGSDHAVYGDLKLVDPTKDVEKGLKIEGIKTVAEYDKILKEKGEAISVAESEKLLLYQREVVNRVGYEALNNLYYMNEEYREGIKYFLTNEQALAYYIEAGLPDGGSQSQVILNFAKIYKAHKQEIQNDPKFLLKLAVSIGLSHSKQVAFWTGTAKPQDPAKRYESFKYLAENVMDLAKDGNSQDFKNLPSALMQFTVNSRLHEDEVVWLAEYALNSKEKFNDKNHLNAYNYITYTGNYKYDEAQYYDENEKAKWDEEYNVSEFEDYGTKGIVRNFIVFEEGGVCGALAKTYATLNEVFGKPSQVVHQPGHAATISYAINDKGEAIWNLQNDVYGWTQSRDEMGQMPLTWGMQSWNSDRSASYVLLTQAVLNDYDNYAKAVRLNIMADVYSDNVKEAQKIYNKALEYQGKQLDSMVRLIDSYKKDETKDSDDFLQLARTISENFVYYPLPMKDLLNLIKTEISETDMPKFNLIKNSALVKASNVADDEVVQANICRTMANHVLSTDRVDFATFSLDGANANKLIVNTNYKDIVGKIKYSLDGGKNFITSDSHTIQLDTKQIESLSADNDILVGIDGFDVVDRIDIKTQAKPSTSNIEVNDRENTFVGQIQNLQFLVNGQWKDYVAGGFFSGDATITTRYKANGTSLASETTEFKFTDSKDPDTKKYVPLSNFEILDVSSEQSEGMVKNLFDGNSKTHFHTSNEGDDERAIVLELKESKTINTVVYQTYTQQGRVAELEVLGSADGNKWVSMGTQTFKEQSVTEMTLTNPMEVKFIKLVAKQTFAKNHVKENTNKFFSGKDFYFYEDSTQPSKIDDKTVSANSTIKKAILEEKAKIEEEKKAKEEGEKKEETQVKDAKVEVVYDVSDDNKSVVATLKTIEGEISFAKDSETGTAILNDKNVNHTFQYKTNGKNLAVKAEIQWLDINQKIEGFGDIMFDGLKGIELANPVTVYLRLDSGIEVVNNDGAAWYKFDENGTFVFKLRNKVTNEIKLVPVKVDWILEK